MNTFYNDYPDTYPDIVVEKLNREYSKNLRPTFLQSITKGDNMQKTKIMQEEENQQNINDQNNNSANNSMPNEEFMEYYRLYSLISSNYCNVVNLLDNLINKTSSSKREIYQEIAAKLNVDMQTFNETYYTTCNMERYSFCNYNQLVYLIIENFIDLVESLSRLTLINDNNFPTAIRLKDSAFNLFRTFVNASPIRY